MTGKEYMSRIKETRRKIRMLKEQIERDTIMAAGVSAIRYDKDRVQTSPSADRMTDIVIKISEATDELKEEVHHLQILEMEAISYLVKLKEEHERVLSYHYLDGCDWKDVAKRMDYDDSYIYELKDKALNELTKVLNNSEQN